MKFTTLLYRCAIAALSLAAITLSHAEDIAYPTIVPDEAVLRNPALNNMKELKQRHLEFLAKQKSQGGAFASQGSGNGFAASGSAPPLTYLHNDFVYSQGAGVEVIGAYQPSTLLHHFGSLSMS